MATKNTFTKILASIGMALAWFPIVAPILLSAVVVITRRIFRLDYLMPAELFPAALAGGGLLVWAALRAQSRRAFIGGSFGVVVGLLAGVMVVPVVTGLASGATEPGGWQWALVIALLIGYTLALAGMGIGGALLLRDLFKTPPAQTGVK